MANEVKLPLQYASGQTIATKYLKENVDTDFNSIHRRNAKAIAAIEGDPSRWENTFLSILESEEFLLAGRIKSNAGAGIAYTSTINCTVSGTIPDAMVGIYDKAKEAALTLKSGAGIGYSFDTLRPKGAWVTGVNAPSSGPIPFMHLYDAGCNTIMSGGDRRGAQMGTFSIEHPDILDFINAKDKAGQLESLNLSVKLTDNFFHAVEEGRSIELHFDGKVYNTIDARKLFNIIMDRTYESSDPGFLLIDRINEMNNNWFCEDIQATNPCWTGDTLVSTIHGPKPFRELAESGNDVDVYCQDPTTQRTLVRTMRNPRLTRKNADVVRIKVDKQAVGRLKKDYAGRYTTYTLTPDHNVYVYDGDNIVKRKAKDLTSGDRLVAHQIKKQGYSGKDLMVLDRGVFKPNYRLLAEKSLGRELVEGEIVHHLDHNHSNNDYGNLQVMQDSEHKSHHLAEWNSNNPKLGATNPNWNDCSVEQMVLAGSQMIKSTGKLTRSLWLESDMPKRHVVEARFGSWQAFKSQCYDQTQPNHVVVGVEEAGSEDVYNGTVDEFHNYYVCDTEARPGNEVTGFLSANCGEQPLPPYGSCLLSSLNLTQFVRAPFTNYAEFDWARFENVVRFSTRMMDNVVEIANLPLQQQMQEIIRKRRHGLGYTGLGNACVMLGTRYGSTEAADFTEEVSKRMAIVSLDEGANLARGKGMAPLLSEDWVRNGNRYVNPDAPEWDMVLTAEHVSKHISVPATELKVSYSGLDFWLNSKYIRKVIEAADSTANFADLGLKLRTYGCRFTHATSIAPTGTISFSANNLSNGVEPSFSWTYLRNVIKAGKKSKVQVRVWDYAYLLFLQIKGVDISQITEESTDDIEHNLKLPKSFVTTADITAEEHINMQAAAQKWIDSSISKTINVPTETTKEEFKDLYLKMWKAGLKGGTTYRFNPEKNSGVLVRDGELEKTFYEFTLNDGTSIEVRGDEKIEYDGEMHVAANLHDAIVSNKYGRY